MGERPSISELILPIATECSRQCTCCPSFAPVLFSRCVSVARIKSDLSNMAALADIEALVVTGGDPLLHPELREVLAVCRRILPKAKLVLHSNLDLIASLGDAEWGCIDRVRVVTVEGVPLQHNDELLARRKRIECRPCPCQKVVTAQRRSLEGTGEMWRVCPERGQWPTVFEGKLYWCRRHCFMALAKVIRDGSGTPLDALARERLAAFLKPQRPAEECRRCAGPDAQQVPWEEIDVSEGSGRFRWWAEATDNTASRRAASHRVEPQRNDHKGDEP